MARVYFEEISKRFGGTHALRDLTLEVDDEEFFVLLGPSGCGKTTALRIAAGLEEPTAGAIYIGDRDVSFVPAKDRDLAMVFQNYALYPHMSVRDNVAFGLRMRGYARDEIERLVQEVTATLGIADLLDRKPGQLSGGQRQRVALGRAMVRRPQAFLMDEPLSNLDSKMRVQMRAELVRLQRDLAATFIYVTHDQVEAMTMGQRIAVLEGGKLQQVGLPQDVYDRPANRFVAEFIGSPAMNVLEGDLVVEGGHTAVRTPAGLVRVSDAASADVREQNITSLAVGIRPEHLTPEATESAAATSAAAASPAAIIEGQADLVESLGSEQHVTVVAGGWSVVANLPSSPRIERGATLRLAVAAEHVHLFDIESGERVGP